MQHIVLLLARYKPGLVDVCSRLRFHIIYIRLADAGGLYLSRSARWCTHHVEVVSVALMILRSGAVRVQQNLCSADRKTLP